jgi:MinD-like ATPase involved in chromosome partitioning or flagellar assembly
LQVQQLLKERTHFTSAAIIPEDAAFDEAMLRGLPLRQVAPKSKALLAIAEIASRLQEGRG